MEFYISVQWENRYVRVKVERTYQSDQIERFKVIARDRTLVLQNNRPLLRTNGMKHRKPDWKMVQGELLNLTFLQSLIFTINRYIIREERKTNGFI